MPLVATPAALNVVAAKASLSEVPFGPRSINRLVPEASTPLPPIVIVPIVPVVPGAIIPATLVKNGVLIRPDPVSSPASMK
jgi:hypothetical protein